MMNLLHMLVCVYKYTCAHMGLCVLSVSVGASTGKCHLSYLRVPEGLERPALSVCLSLSLLIQHEEKQQREHRMRKGAVGQHKEDNKGHERKCFMCLQTVLM